MAPAEALHVYPGAQSSLLVHVSSLQIPRVGSQLYGAQSVTIVLTQVPPLHWGLTMPPLAVEQAVVPQAVPSA